MCKITVHPNNMINVGMLSPHNLVKNNSHCLDPILYVDSEYSNGF